MIKGNLPIYLLYAVAFMVSIFTGEVLPDAETQLSIVPLIAGGAMIAGGIAKGIAKRRAAKKMRDKASKDMKAAEEASENLIQGLEKNKFQTPDAAKASLALAQNELNSNQLQTALDAQADNNLAGMTSTMTRTATSGADAMAAAQKAYGMSQEQKQQNAVLGAQQRQQNVQNVMGAQSEIGQYEDLGWQRNVLLPMSQRLELQQGKLGNAANQYNASQSAMYDTAGMFGDALMGAGSAFLGMSGAMGGGGSVSGVGNPVSGFKPPAATDSFMRGAAKGMVKPYTLPALKR